MDNKKDDEVYKRAISIAQKIIDEQMQVLKQSVACRDTYTVKQNKKVYQLIGNISSCDFDIVELNNHQERSDK